MIYIVFSDRQNRLQIDTEKSRWEYLLKFTVTVTVTVKNGDGEHNFSKTRKHSEWRL